MTLAAALLVASCSYSEDDSWQVCCLMRIVGDESSSSPSRQMLVESEQRTLFNADGVAFDSTYYSGKRKRIASAIDDFLKAHPEARASAYLASLGMTCGPAPGEGGVERCRIELPVWVQCGSLNIFFPGGAPIPKELREPMVAHLAVSIDVSGPAYGDTFARILPAPGGRLCHR
jgi:hypothetical protein